MNSTAIPVAKKTQGPEKRCYFAKNALTMRNRCGFIAGVGAKVSAFVCSFEQIKLTTTKRKKTLKLNIFKLARVWLEEI